ncbi:MAG: hypothetical protein CL920_11680 [Deltaproteobacteria bacterium]|nr:hypothetical protein [Deltaproteobacteria bacterium]|tara:strand:- start:449 stop:751 length:303 start_codon:yes stop_codon:yes gene_type:complete
MTNSTGQPTSGARFQFTRKTHSPEQSVYNVEVFLPDQTLYYVATLTLENGLDTLTPKEETQAAAPEWAQKYIDFLCKQLHREAKKDGTWPRKLRQWKPEK